MDWSGFWKEELNMEDIIKQNPSDNESTQTGGEAFLDDRPAIDYIFWDLEMTEHKDDYERGDEGKIDNECDDTFEA